MYLNTSMRAWASVTYPVSIHSVLSEPKQLSLMALSHGSPLRGMLIVSPSRCSRSRNAPDAYWTPRSEWWTRSPWGHRRRNAISKAAQTNAASLDAIRLQAKIQPALGQTIIGNFRQPLLIRTCGVEVSVQPVGGVRLL